MPDETVVPFRNRIAELTGNDPISATTATEAASGDNDVELDLPPIAGRTPLVTLTTEERAVFTALCIVNAEIETIQEAAIADNARTIMDAERFGRGYSPNETDMQKTLSNHGHSLESFYELSFRSNYLHCLFHYKVRQRIGVESYLRDIVVCDGYVVVYR